LDTLALLKGERAGHMLKTRSLAAELGGAVKM